MVNLKITKDAVIALNNSFKQDPLLTEDERIIEFAVVREKGQEDVLSYALWNISPEELNAGVFKKVDMPEEAEFRGVVSGAFAKYFEGIEVDYNIVYSELKDSEGEVFIFRQQKSEQSSNTN